MIALKPVTSKAMQAYGYHAPTQVLAVRFSAGKVHHYKGVPPDVVAEMEAAESLGSYFARLIRGKYPHEVVLDESEHAESSDTEAQRAAAGGPTGAQS